MRKLFFIIPLLILSVASAETITDAMTDIFTQYPNVSLGIGLGILVMAIAKFSLSKQGDQANFIALALGVATFLIIIVALPESTAVKYAKYSVYVVFAFLSFAAVTFAFKGTKLDWRWLVLISSVVCFFLGNFLSSKGFYEISGPLVILSVVFLIVFVIGFLFAFTGLKKKR